MGGWGHCHDGKKEISHINPHVRRSTCKGGGAASLAVALAPAAALAAKTLPRATVAAGEASASSASAELPSSQFELNTST